MANYKIKSLHKTDRPREKIVKHGVGFLSTSELLAVLIGSGYEGKNAIQLAKDVLSKYHRKNLPRLSYEQLVEEKGIGNASACRILAAFELAQRLLLDHDEEAIIVKKPEDVFRLLKEIGNYKKEHFIGLYLNTRHQLIHRETISVGGLEASIVHPREVFEPALKHHASALIVAHNHPSGNLEPSDEDLIINQTLVKASKILGLEVIDHIIITNKDFTSLKDRGDI